MLYMFFLIFIPVTLSISSSWTLQRRLRISFSSAVVVLWGSSCKRGMLLDWYHDPWQLIIIIKLILILMISLIMVFLFKLTIFLTMMSITISALLAPFSTYFTKLTFSRVLPSSFSSSSSSAMSCFISEYLQQMWVNITTWTNALKSLIQ